MTILGEELENVNCAFVLGILVSLNKTHYILSNKELVYRRYDIMIIRKYITGPRIIV